MGVGATAVSDVKRAKRVLSLYYVYLNLYKEKCFLWKLAWKYYVELYWNEIMRFKWMKCNVKWIMMMLFVFAIVWYEMMLVCKGKNICNYFWLSDSWGRTAYSFTHGGVGFMEEASRGKRGLCEDAARPSIQIVGWSGDPIAIGYWISRGDHRGLS